MSMKRDMASAYVGWRDLWMGKPVKHRQIFVTFKKNDYTQILALNNEKQCGTCLHYLCFLSHFYALFMI